MELKGSKTEANLWIAFAGESQARNKYDYFASKAKKEGYEQIAAIFQETAGNEKEHAKLWFKELGGIGDTHEERYLKLLDNLKKGEVFKKGEKVMWFCRNCGHVEIAESAPAVCPVCKHPQAYFQVKAENY